MKREDAVNMIEWALTILILIVISFPFSLLVWSKLSAGLGMILFLFSVLLFLIGWPFAGTLLGLVLRSGSFRKRLMGRLSAAVFLWLVLGGLLACSLLIMK